ncbi:MAG: DUF6261 family protein [Mediterranea sp.]|jgi:hypothetical protein|nr:DUF6261 family protein [Mediterranea sp.]
MPISLIKPLKLEELNISELLECSTLLIKKVYTDAVAQAVGLGGAYEKLVAAHTKYSIILKHNPTLIETESLTKDVLRVRNLMGALSESLRVAGIINNINLVEALKLVSSITTPYLKTRHTATMSALLGDAGDMCEALQEATTAPKVSALGLTEQVTAIKELVDRCNDLLSIRGEEIEYRQRLGSASKARITLQKQYRLIFATVIPGIYLTTSDSTIKQRIIEIVNQTNATLNIFRHLVSGGGSMGSGGVGDEDTRPDKPEVPDQPGEEPGGNGDNEDNIAPPGWEDPDA